mgnify:FL=1|tara:strand:- start:6757 stop:7134 length:378 start_codon:yes stop_codon:yes gene_type:complete
MLSLMNFISTHWKGIMIASLLFVVSFFWWQDHKGLVNAYDASIESYEVRIRELSESYQREAERKDEVLQEYKEKIYILESEYLDFKENIERLKDERIEEIITLRHENPEQLISEIENRFGFEYVE